MRRRNWALGATAAVAALLAATITASPSGALDPFGQITVEATGGTTPGFSADRAPSAITTGADGLVWFVETDGGHVLEPLDGAPVGAVGSGLGPSEAMSGAIARRNADGSISEFDAGLTVGTLASLAPGPDGNLWFAEFNPPSAVGRITPDGTITEVLVGGSGGLPAGNVQDVITGPDGNLWFTMPIDGRGVGRLTPSGDLTIFPGPAGVQTRYLAVGADGNLWVTYDGSAGQGVYTVSMDGVFTLVAEAGVTPGLATDAFPYAITAGPDGALWTAVVGGVARITTAGAVTTFTRPGLDGKFLNDVASGCGSLWMTQGDDEGSTSSIYQVTTAGTFIPYVDGLPTAADPQGITVGPDQNMWFTGRSDPGLVLSIGAPCVEPPFRPTTTTTTTTPTTPPAARPVSASPRFTG